MTEVGSGITSSSDKNLETKFEKGASDRNAHPEPVTLAEECLSDLCFCLFFFPHNGRR